jgi:hypothetical protein
MAVVARGPQGHAWCAGRTCVGASDDPYDRLRLDRLQVVVSRSKHPDADVREMGFSLRMAALI